MLRKTSLFIICFLFCLPAFAKTVENEAHDPYLTSVEIDANSTRLSFDFKDIDLSATNQGKEFNRELTVHRGVTYDYGRPMLPRISRFVAVHPTSKIELSIKSNGSGILDADQSFARCLDPDLREFASIEDKGLYPRQSVEISEPFIIRGVRMVKITTYPVQYDLENDRFIHNRQITAEIRNVDGVPVNPVTHPRRINRSREFLRFLNVLAVNGDELFRDDPEDANPPYNGHYLVVSHANCLQYAGPFIEFRRKAGYKVDLLSLPGNVASSPNEVKNRIQQRYDAYLEQGIDPFDQILLIGDRSTYVWNQAGWVLDAERGETVHPGQPYHADYKYALLEGGDLYPDVGISRWCAGDPDRLNLFTNRTLGYIANPNMQNRGWFKRGAVYTQHWGNDPERAWDVTIHTNVRWGKEALEQKGFDDVRFFEDYEYDQNGFRVGEFVMRQFNEGVNFLVGRAEMFLWQQSFQGVNDNTVFPIRLVLSGHGEFATWSMLRTGDGEHLKGPVVATCNWGTPPTITNNAVWLELVNGMVQHELTFGWTRNLAITKTENYFPNFQFGYGSRAYTHIKTDTDCYGDPGIAAWTDAPKTVAASFPATIGVEPSLIDVFVFDEATNQPVPGAIVTVYAPGNLPEFADGAYAEYDGMQMRTTKTDHEGMAYFVFEDGVEFVQGTPVYITVTGKNIRPYTRGVQAGVQPVGAEIADYSLSETEGNGDGEPNPGETFELAITAGNSNNAALNNVAGTVISPSPYVNVEGNGRIQFGNVQPGEQTGGESPAVITIASNCPDGASRPGAKPVIIVEFTSDGLDSKGAVELTPIASNFEVHQIIDGGVIPLNAADRELTIDLANVGAMTSPEVTAELFSQGAEILVESGESAYEAIDSGESGQNANPFALSAHPQSVPGATIDMLLVLSSQAGFIDTAKFILTVGEPVENSPQGPDKYGYFCFDDTDGDWSNAPEYDWIELSLQERDRDFDGVLIEAIDGQSQFDIGESAVIPLPFEIGFYGEVYDTITVCSNGYICPGNQQMITNFQNWPLDRGIGGGAGMIAPLWDWMAVPDNAGIYYYYDAETSRFIIEWYKLRQRPNGERDRTFEVVLSDRSRWAKETGDTDILFYYRTADNAAGQDSVHEDQPYASVGLSHPDGTTGLSYTYYGDYPVTSAPIADERALKFTTSIREHNGTVYGRVTNAANGQPLQGIRIETAYGLSTPTGGDGRYSLENVVRSHPFDLIAWSGDELSDIRRDLVISDEDRLEINFDLDLSVDDSPPVAHSFGLHSAYPNPFNSSVTVEYSLEGSSHVNLSVFDLSGKKVESLIDGRMNAGNHSAVWSPEDVSSGIYIVRLFSENGAGVLKVLLLR